jgi:hypothetical protein
VPYIAAVFKWPNEFDITFVVATAAIWGLRPGTAQDVINAAAAPIAPCAAAAVCLGVLSPDQEVKVLQELLK